MDDKQSNFPIELQKFEKSTKALQKCIFQLTWDYYLVQEL